MNVDPQLRNHAAAGDDASATSTPAAQQQQDTTQSPQQQQQQQHHNHAAQQHHQQPPPPPPQGATYNPTPGQAGAFSPQTPNSAVSSLTNPAAANYPPSTVHDDDNDPHHHADRASSSFATPPALGPGGVPLLDKKARACESCRGLKVRCEPDPSNPNPDDGPCRRCAKAGRACVVTQPTRKRQKKTDSRVAELEKKIDALTASLHATRGGSGSGSSGSAIHHERDSSSHAAAAAGVVGEPYNPLSSAVASSRPPPLPWQGASAQQAAAPMQQGPAARAQAVPHVGALGQSPAKFGGMEIDFGKAKGPPPMVMAGQKRKLADAGGGSSVGEDRAASAPPVPPQVSPSMGHEYSDCIDRAILSMDKANELWARYTECMVPHLPGVVFPAGTTAAEIRKTKPVLFLSIMAVSSSELPSVQRTLTKELMQILADKVIVVGEKSLELVQALQVAVMWYWPPEHFEELKFYQLVHIAAVMAIDIGLGRKKTIMEDRLGLKKHIPAEWRQQHFKKHRRQDPTSVEARRAWLACYFLATNTSMALHRPNLIRWNSFMTECVDVLESSPEAAPTDKYFCHLVWTHKLAEEVGIQFAMDDPSASINVADSRTQYALRGFERDLEKYSSSISEEFRQPSLILSFHVLNLYMHEIATQPEHTEEWKQASTADQIRDALASDVPLTPAHINALSACLTAIDGIFDVFLSMEVSSIRCLPVFNFVRVAYAVVVLIKMYFAASSPKSELGKVINKDNMKVEQHLDNLLEKFGLTAGSDKSRPASKFLVVLVMLRSWFQKQKGSEASTAGDKPAQPAGTDYRTPQTDNSPPTNQSIPQAQDQTQQQPPQQQQDYSATANTPLQLLSEIATKDSNGTGSSTGATPRPTPDFYWAGRQPQQPFIYDDANSTGNNTSSTPTNTSAPNPDSGTTTGFPYGTGGSSSSVAQGINWLDVAGFDYSGIGFGDGFAQAMDLTLTGIADGSMMSALAPPGSWDGNARYASLQDAAFLGALDGMGMGGGGGGGAPGNGGGGGGYQF